MSSPTSTGRQHLANDDLGVRPVQDRVPILVGGHSQRVVSIAAWQADVFQFTGLTHDPASGRLSAGGLRQPASSRALGLGAVDSTSVVAAVVALVSVVSSFLLAFQAQRAAREAAARERSAARATAFRDEQVDVIERALLECAEVLNQAYAIHNRWALSGEPHTSYEVTPRSGPGALDPNREGIDAHEYYGTRMDEFHRRCRLIQLLANRIGDDDVRRSMHHFVGRTENYRLLESIDEMTVQISEIQASLDELFTRGGSYSRELFVVERS